MSQDAPGGRPSRAGRDLRAAVAVGLGLGAAILIAVVYGGAVALALVPGDIARVLYTAPIKALVSESDHDTLISAFTSYRKRLNAVDGEEQPARWARESTVLRLRPDDRPRA